ncbi:MAG: hypothetical protein HKN25_16900 [Pyrinomonadaceae bacterium]|nr:hypothetical protein [Pyrinomonadaceae bacterium]
MNFEVNSTNSVVQAIAGGTAPKPAQLAASRGALPLPQIDLLEALVILARSEDKEIAVNAEKTLKSQDNEQLKNVISSPEVAPQVLDYFATQETLSQEIYEVVISNPKTPNQSIVKFAETTLNGELLEVVSLNQQLLINTPELIDAILKNPKRTSEADRRASEIKKEFFEKERGAKQIADELRAQGKEAAAEFIEESEFAEDLSEDAAEGEVSVEDAVFLANFIEVPDDEIDDSWLSLEYIEEIYEETPEERQAIVGKILGEMKADGDDEISGERISMVQKIMAMGMKDRVKFAAKGDREARNVLIRDPNKIVSQAVIKNPKITEQEVEKISTMKTVPEDVLRIVAMDKKFARNYSIIHNLAKNPRTPIGNVISILTRLQLRDLVGIQKNRNVPDAVRKQAQRLVNARTGGKG